MTFLFFHLNLTKFFAKEPERFSLPKTEQFLSEGMVVKIEVMQIKESGFTETFSFAL